MTFRYINPGYAELLSGKGMSTTESFDYNPENGVAFTANTNNDFIEIIPAGYFSNEVHFSFDLYTRGSARDADAFFIGLAKSNDLNTNYNVLGIGKINSTQLYIARDSNRIKYASTYLKTNALNSIRFSCNLQKVTASLTINGETTTASNLGSMEYYGINSPLKITLPNNSSYGTFYISNLIISDEYISPKERIIALPIKQTFTDMTAGESGIYIADAANQTLLQTPDVAALIEKYGADSKITGVEVVGKPAYKTATGLANLIALSKSSENISEHNTVALSDDTTASIMDGWGLSGVTISDLQNMQFGWKVGE